MLTVEEILAALQAIIDEAAAAAGEGEEPALTEEQASRYEELERQLAARRRSDNIVERNSAYRTPERRSAVPAGAGRRTGDRRHDDELTRAFMAYLRTGQQNADIVQLRAQSEGVGSEGGFLVPDGFRDKLVDRMVKFGGIAAKAEEITTATGNPLPWPTIDDTANQGEIVAEGGTFSSGADLVFGVESLGAYKYMAGGGSSLPLRVPVELAQDASYDLEGLITRKLGERIGRIQAVHVVRGTGVNEPKGIITGLTGVEGADDLAEPTYADLITWEHSVDPAYREGGNCGWAFNDNSLEMIKKMVDSHGDPLWRPNTADMGTSPGGGTLNGYPVTIDQAFPDRTANSASINWGVFGDIREGYVVRRVREVVVIVNPWTRAANGQIEYTAWARMDATQQNTNAYIAMTGFVA